MHKTMMLNVLSRAQYETYLDKYGGAAEQGRGPLSR